MRVQLTDHNSINRMIDTDNSELLGQWLLEFCRSLDLTHGPAYAWSVIEIRFS